MKRRVFLEAGACLSLASLLPLSARAAGPAAPVDPARPVLLLVDQRSALGRERAANAAARGIPTAAVADDVTQFFYERLHGRWRRDVPALAGLTGWGPYFCLSQLARDQDMRLVLQEEIAGTGGQATLYAWVALPRLPYALASA